MKKILSVVMTVVLLFNTIATSFAETQIATENSEKTRVITNESKSNDKPISTLIKVYNSGNGHDYAVIDQEMPWEEANAYCQSLGGYLATITSKEEQRFVSSILSKADRDYYLLGASRTDGVNWSWISDEEFNYNNWQNSADSNDKGTKYLVLDKTLKKWSYIMDSMVAADKTLGFICEWNSNYYMEFNGNDYIKANYTKSIKTNNLTVEALVKPVVLNDVDEKDIVKYPANAVFVNALGCGLGFGVSKLKDSSLITVAYPGGFRKINDIKLNEDEWYHVASVYSDKDCKTYVNGFLVDSFTFDAEEISFDKVYIGKYGYDNKKVFGNKNTFKGSIDDVRIWDRILEPNEIMDRINKYTGSDEKGIVGYWNFNNNNENVVPDLCKYKCDGTIYNNPKSVLVSEKNPITIGCSEVKPHSSEKNTGVCVPFEITPSVEQEELEAEPVKATDEVAVKGDSQIASFGSAAVKPVETSFLSTLSNSSEEIVDTVPTVTPNAVPNIAPVATPSAIPNIAPSATPSVSVITPKALLAAPDEESNQEIFAAPQDEPTETPTVKPTATASPTATSVPTNTPTQTADPNVTPLPDTVNSNFVLKQDQVIEGDLTVKSGNIDLNGFTLTVKGSLYQLGGNLNINKGKLIVKKDYKIQNETKNESGVITYSNSSGYIVMKNDQDYVLVEGNFVTQSSSGNTLSAGVMEIKGNFTQKNGYQHNFNASGNHKVVLSGSNLQTMDIESTYTSFGTLDATKASEVIFKAGFIKAANLIGFDKINVPQGSNMTLQDTNLVMDQDKTIQNGLIINSGSVDLGGKKLTVKGKATIAGTLKINSGVFDAASSLVFTSGKIDVGKGTLAIAGEMLQSGGELNVNSGSVEIAGDYRLQTRNVNEENKVTYGNSSGYVVMGSDIDSIKINGDLYVQNNNSSNKLTAGTIEIKGNFTQKKGYDYNFTPSGTHKVIMNGGQKQTISFESPTYSRFNVLELKQSTVAEPSSFTATTLYGIEKLEVPSTSSNMTMINTKVTLTSDIVLNYGLTLSGGSFNLAGNSLTVKGKMITNADIDINEGKLIVTGDLDVTGGKVDINKGQLTVNGNIQQSAGVMDIHIGRLEVAGDYRLQTRNVDELGKITYSNSSGYIVMTRDSDYVQIGGNLYIQNSNYSNNLTAGTIELKGDFTQKKGYDSNFAPSGNHKVIMNGTAKQTISFESPSSSKFNILDLTGSAGVTVNKPSMSVTTLYGIEKLEVPTAEKTLTLINTKTSLTSDTAFNFGLVLSGGTLNLSGYSLTVKGDMQTSSTIDFNEGKIDVASDLFVSGGKIDINKGNLTVGGNVIQSSGVMDIHIGKMEVAGDYRLQTRNIDEEERITYSNSSGYIVMTRESDYLKIGGDLYIQNYNYSNNLTSGTIELKGNFTQKKGYDSNFTPSGSHKVVFTGTAKQTINFESPSNSKFNILDLKESAGVLVNAYTLIATTLYGIEKLDIPSKSKALTLLNTNTTLTGDTTLDFGLALSGGTINLAGFNFNINGSFSSSGTIDVSAGKLNVSSDMTISGGKIDINKGNLTVGGNILHSSGIMDIRIGSLNVTGDYRLQTKNVNEEGVVSYSNSSGYIVMTRDSDSVKIGGDLYIQNSNYSNNLTAGTIELKGNFIQKKGYDSNFTPSGTHKMVLTGTEKQTISFESPSSSKFNVLDVRGSAGAVISPASLQATTLYGVDKLEISSKDTALTLIKTNTTLETDAVINSGLVLNGGSLNQAGFKLDVKGSFETSGTIDLNSGKLNVESDLTLTGGKIDINKGNITVGGNILQPSGIMEIRMGSLDVVGDYRLQTRNVNEEGVVSYSNSSGYIVMTRTSDSVKIGGDLYIQNSNSSNNLTAGTIELKGSFIQKKGYEYNFSPSGTHKMVMTGTKKQTISFETPNSSKFNILDLQGAVGAVINPTSIQTTTLYGIEKLEIPSTEKTLTLIKTSTSLTQDTVFNFNLVTSGGNIDFAGYGLNIKGGFSSSATMDLNQGKLDVAKDFELTGGKLDINRGKVVVKGNILHSSGIMDIHIGSLEVAGDYRLQNRTVSEDKITYGNSSGYIVMTRDSDSVKIGGDLYIQNSNSSNNLTAGTIELKGSFIQKKGYEYNFSPSGTHKMVMTGTKKQTISFETPNSSKFNILDLQGAVGAVINPTSIQTTTLYGIEKLEIPSTEKTLTLIKTSTSLTQDTVFNFNLVTSGGNIDFAGYGLNIKGGFSSSATMDLNQGKLDVAKDFELTGGKLDINRGKVVVKGNILHSSGIMDIHIGSLEVAGDYRLQNRTVSEDKITYGNSSGYIVMTRDSDSVKIGGDLYIQNYNYSNNLTAGTIELKGNFTQKKGYDSNFIPSGTHKLILNGTTTQTINFEAGANSRFNYLDASQAAGVLVTSATISASTFIGLEKVSVPNGTATLTLANTNAKLTGDGSIKSGLSLTGGSLDLSGKTLTLRGVLTITNNTLNINGGMIKGVSDLLLKSGTLNLGGSELSISGDMRQSGGTCDINKGKLIVAGNLIQSAGEMNIRMGRLEVLGDYRIQSEVVGQNGSLTYTDSSGYLVMSRDSDYVKVDGSFTTQSTNGSNVLSAGTFQLKGDFTQKIGWGNMTTNFLCKGTHKALLCGNSMQKIFFESPNSHFNIVERIATTNITLDYPKTGGQGGKVTLQFSGAGLTENLEIKLINDTKTITAEKISVAASDVAYATFDLKNQPLGVYNISINDGESSVLLENAFSIVPAVTGELRYTCSVPQALRPGQKGTLTIDYVNNGNTDTLPPFIDITAENAKLKFLHEEEFGSSNIQIIDVNALNSLGVIPPGGTGRITLVFAPENNVNSVNFSANVLPEYSVAMNWADVKNEAKPENITSEAWNAIWKNFTDSVGSTVGSYMTKMSSDASYLKSIGRDIDDTGILFGFELLKANNPFPRPILFTATDFSLPSKGLPMVFERASEQYLAGRFKSGVFGRGWTHTYDISALKASNGDVNINISGSTRVYTKLADGSYKAPYGDSSVLKLQDGKYTLNYQDGTVISFRADGKFEYIEDVNKNRITGEYNSGNQLVKIKHSDGDSFTIKYNEKGLIKEISDNVGHTRTYEYDEAGEHLIAVKGTEGTTQYSYWKVPTGVGGIQLREHAITSVTNPDGTHKYFDYDERGRLSKEYEDGNHSLMSYTYDEQGRVYFTDSIGGTTVISYNDLGLESEIMDAVGKINRYTYDSNGNMTVLRGPENAVYTYSYDSKGNVVKQSDPTGRTMEMSYDDKGRVKSIRDAGRLFESYDYDEKGNVISVTDSDNLALVYEYDSFGNVLKVTNKRGQTIDCTYNERGQVTSRKYSDGTKVDYAYNSKGNLVTATSGTEVTTMKYDSKERLEKVEYPTGRSVTFGYDAANRRNKVTYSDGYVLNYTYDQNGHLKAVLNGDNKQIVGYKYDSAGRMTRKELGNGTYSVYEYDAIGNNTKITNYAPDAKINSKYEYVYNSRGYISKVITLEGENTYGYDAVGRLASVNLSNGRSIVYSYDIYGNRIKVKDNGVDKSYSANGLNQYKNAGDDTFVYDKDGNLVSKVTSAGQYDYTYNIDNKITQSTFGENVTKYEYDQLGNLLYKEEGGKKIEYLTDPMGEGNIIAEYGDNGALIARNIYGIGLVGRVGNDGSINYYDSDNVGSIVGISGKAGTYVNKYTYLPFGEVVTQSETVSNPFKYCGQWGVTDEGNGLYNMRARMYDSNTGRFMSVDPVGIGSLETNLYTYCHNNPLFLSDPSGENPLVIAGAIIGAVAGGAFYAVGSSLTGNFTWGGLAGSVISGGITGGLTGLLGPGVSVLGVLGSGAAGGIGSGIGSIIDQGLNGSIDWGKVGIDALIGTGAGIVGGLIPFRGEGTFWTRKFPWGDIGRGGKYTAAWFLNGPRGKAMWDYLWRNLGWGTLVGLGVGNRNKILDFIMDLIASRDPNDIVGPEGYGEGHYIPKNDSYLNYTIHFENDEEATAAAQYIEIRQRLDNDLDFSTFQLGSFGFGDFVFDVPKGASTYSKRLDIREKTGLYLDVNAGIDRTTGDIFWTMQCIDPNTGEPPLDAYAGFLPPDVVKGEGQGFVTYSIKAAPDIADGEVIDAEARIIFDTNDPIDTPPIFNTIDASKPTTSLKPLPEVTAQSEIELVWDGTDGNGSGIKSVDLYVSKDGGPFTAERKGITDKRIVYTGTLGSKYSFFVQAVDNAGNLEDLKSTAEASTSLGGVVYGDVNGDGKITSYDYTLVRDYVLRKISKFPDDNGIVAADVNGDKKITSYDYTLIRDYVLRRINKFPVSK